MNEETIEIRRLITKAQSYICSGSADISLCERAKKARSIVHENADLRTVLLGIEQLEGLLREMDVNNIEGFKRLQNELIVFKKNSRAWQESRTSLGQRKVSTKPSFEDAIFLYMSGYAGTGLAKIDDAIHSEHIQSAADILNDLKQNWRIGPYFVPLNSEIEPPNEVELEKVFSKWYDMTYWHVNRCIEILSEGREKLGMRKTWMGWNVQTFEMLKNVCQLALEAKDQWAPPIIRLLIFAAQELRKSASSGKHGPDRLGAKLVVGKLIGDLSQYDIDSALILADLTIESISFSRSQVLYAHESNPEALETLIDRWHKDEHPMYRDIVAQAHIFIEEESEAREVLCTGKEQLQTAKARCYSTSRGEYFVKRYTEHLEDIYLARLSRTLSLIDAKKALKWCDEIATPNIRMAGYLHIFLNNPHPEGEHTASRVREISQFFKDCGFAAEDFWLPAYELRKLPYLTIYPEFPAERWKDLMKQPFTSYENIMKVIVNNTKQCEE